MGKIYKRKDRGTWRIVFFDRGQRHREDYRSKKIAKKMLIIREEEVLRGKYNFDMEHQSPKFEKFARDYLEYARMNKRSWERDELFIEHLFTHFAGRKLNQISSEMIETYKMGRRTYVSQCPQRENVKKFESHNSL